MNLIKEAFDLLEALEITYERYDHKAIFSTKDYDFFLPEIQVKNLLLKPKKSNNYYMVLIDENKNLDLKHLATLLDTKRLSFVSNDELEKILPVSYGNITPIALMYENESKVTVIIDSKLDKNKPLGVHPNLNTITLMISFADLEKFLKHTNHNFIYLDL